jgi:hypothetical protein
MNVDAEKIISEIIEKSKLTRAEVITRMNKEIDDLNGLIDEEGGLLIVSKTMGLDYKPSRFNLLKDLFSKRLSSGIFRIKIIDAIRIRKVQLKSGESKIVEKYLVSDVNASPGEEKRYQFINWTGVIETEIFPRFIQSIPDNTEITIIDGYVKYNEYERVEQLCCKRIEM